MNKLFIVFFVIGLLVGTIIGYASFMFASNQTETEGPKSWHSVASFVLAINSTPGTIIAYPQDVYNGTGPEFTVKGEFWRMKLESVPYYNYSDKGIAYYAPIPFAMRVVIPPTTSYHFPSPSSSIALVEPAYYGVNNTFCHPDEKLSYAYPNRNYAPVRAVYTFSGAGTYLIYVETGTACFSFIVEDYY